MRKPSNHILFWIVYTLYFYISGVITSPERFAQLPNIIKNIIISVVEMMILFYILVLYIFPKTLPKKKYKHLAIALLSLSILASLGNTSIIYGFSVLVKTSHTFNFYRSFTLGLNNLYISINFALAYWFATTFIQNVREQSEAKIQKSSLEQSILEAELSSLKNQINPHFFYNSLNFLYAQALPLSKRLSDSVMLLSEMLRYTIKENDNEGKVYLEQEIKYIKNYIHVKQLQFSEPLNIHLEFNGNIGYRRILPMTLSMFVENAVKFGELHKIESPIKIVFSTQANHLYLTLSFTLKKGIDSHDIDEDLQEVRRRLYIAYFNKHSLKLNYENNIQKIFMRITL